MARRVITEEDVAKACNDLVAAGEAPSILGVFSILKKGSNSTIQKYMRIWEESEEAKNAKIEQLPAVIELPQEFVDESNLLLKKIFRLAEQQNAHKITQIQQEKEQAIASAKADVAQSIDFADALSTLKEQLEDDIEVKDKEISELKAEILDLNTRNSGLSDANTSLKAESEGLESQIEQLASAISELEKSEALLKQERDAANSGLDKAQEKHGSDIANLKSDHKEAIKELDVQHEKATQNLIEANNKAVADLKAANDSAIAELKSANTQTVSTLQQGLEDAQKQRDNLKTELTESIQRFNESQGNCENLRGELTTANNKIAQLESELAKAQENKVNEQTQQ